MNKWFLQIFCWRPAEAAAADLGAHYICLFSLYSGPPFCKCPSILFQGAFTYVHVYSTFIMNGFKAVHNYLWKSIWRFSLNQHTIGPSYLEVSWRSKYLCLLGWSWFGMKLAFFSIFVKIEPLWKWPPFSSSSNYCLLQQHVTKNVQ